MSKSKTPKRKIPDTSVEAWKSIDPSQLAQIYCGILYALGIMHRGTFEEIAAHMKVDKSRVWKRMSELERMKLVYRPGSKKMLKSGRQGYEWALTSQVSTKTDKDLKALKGKPTIIDHSRNIQSISEQTKLFLDTL
jgi:DNA-binding transcriptional regulator GbsR (MarR family)